MRVRTGMQNPHRSFVSDQRGATAVEFAFIALPFLALLFGIIQLAVIFFSGSVLDTGVKQAARLVLTGQAQEDSWAPPEEGQNTLDAKIAKFRSEICNYTGTLLNCNNIKLDIRVLGRFDDPIPGIPMENGELIDGGFEPGDRNEIVMVRAMYLLPVYADILGSGLINAGTNKRLIVSTVVFENEPF